MDSPIRLGRATRDVLEALLSAREAHDGLRIARDARRYTATVYPILADLEACGWVHSYWHDEEGETAPARRRVYRLMPHGCEAARELLVQHGTSRRPSRVPVGRPRPVSALLRPVPRPRWETR